MAVDCVLTIRVSRDLAGRLAREARRRRQTRGAAARALLAESLGTGAGDQAAEARRQSLLVKRRASERDALSFIAAAAETAGWR